MSSIPGWVGKDQAVYKTEIRREVLVLMEETGSSVLPVVSDDGQFLGIVDRSRLTTSIILDIMDTLDAIDLGTQEEDE